MTTEILEYLSKIGISGILIKKVEDVFNVYVKYLNCKIDDIFVSEYINQDGSRVYENLWFFNSTYCYEAKLFMTSDNFDAALIKNAVVSFTLKKTEFDVINDLSNVNSRISLEVFLKENTLCNLKASKENCIQLSMIFKKYFQPNLVKEL